MLKIDPADAASLGAMVTFLEGLPVSDLPAIADLAVIDDGTPVTGEVMNLLARRNLLYAVVTSPDARFRLNVAVGTREYPVEDAADPSAFALKIRRQLTDDQRALRIYGSEVVIARLTGDARRIRLHLINYGGRDIEGLRVRVRGGYRTGDAYLPGAGRVALLDHVVSDGATECSLPRFGPYAVIDLVRPDDRMNPRPFFQGKAVLITGASSGIGEALAWQLSQAGAHLTLTARRTHLLDALAQRIAGAGKPQPVVMRCDVTRDGDVERAVAESTHRWGRLDVVIANAGFGVVGALRDLSVDDYRRQFETNVFGVLRTIYAALPDIEKTRGNVVIVGSVAGWVATPGGSPYAMSKFAVRALADAITPELRLTRVTLTLISPGFVASDIRRVDNRGTLHAQAPDPVPQWLLMPTEKAAHQILRAVARGKAEAIITGHGKILVTIERFMPWLARVVKRRIAARGGYRPEANSTTSA